MRSFVAVLALVVLPSCSAPAGDADVGSTSEAITHGAVDDADVAVVALVGADGSLECTGTLIGPSLVLTAAHCLSAGEPLKKAHFGTNARSPSRVIDVAEAHAHPSFDSGTLANDIAVLVLVAAADGIAPKTVAAPGDALRTSDRLRTVGFGRTGPLTAGATAGTRREGTAALSEISDARVTLSAAPSQPCSGDSGGPAFGADERVVGVTSEGDVDCVTGTASTRVSAYADFLAPFLAPPAPAPAAGGCAVAHSVTAEERVAPLMLMLAFALAAVGRRRKRGACSWKP